MVGLLLVILPDRALGAGVLWVIVNASKRIFTKRALGAIGLSNGGNRVSYSNYKNRKKGDRVRRLSPVRVFIDSTSR